MTCINICSLTLDLPYLVLITGNYSIEIVSSLKERYFATLPFVAGDSFTMTMPPLNEFETFKLILTDSNGVVEKVLYFATYPYALFLA